VAPLPEQVVAVIVAFHPDLPALRKLMDAAGRQVGSIVVVDNTPDGSSLPATTMRGVTCIHLGFNAGLAAALNRGCEWAAARGATYVLLFDQDSVPADDMLVQLARAWTAAEAAGTRVAAAGPKFQDSRGAPVFPFLRVGLLRNQVVVPAASDQFVLTHTLITSGCLVSCEALSDVGPMNESLFIDNVDLEWGFRAAHRGWALIGAPRATLAHSIGDDHVRAPWWARLFGKPMAIRHGAPRLYYITRNRIRLYWMPHVPLGWKVQDLLRLPAKIILSLWLAQDRAAAASALARGVRDGLADRGGAMR
jgi:rhamnosyltransferase